MADRLHPEREGSKCVISAVNQTVHLVRPQDDKEAMVWYHKAAEHWNVEAMLRLAESYGSGRGVTQDDLSAYMWYSIAATASSADGKMARDRMEQQLSAQQLQQARELAQRCQDSKFQECR